MTNKHSLLAIKASNDTRNTLTKLQSDRHRDCLVLIKEYLEHHNYQDTVKSLLQEGDSSLSKYVVADNIDLMSILVEFEEYRDIKFGQKPKLTRKVTLDSSRNENQLQTTLSKSRKQDYRRLQKIVKKECNTYKYDPSHVSSETTCKEEEKEIEHSVKVTGSTIELTKTSNKNNPKMEESLSYHDRFQPRLLKPLPPYYQNDPDMKNLASAIQCNIIQQAPNTKWEDIIGLDDAKSVIKEAIVFPLKYPKLYSELKMFVSPWRGVLLFGPPGTGKTMLARATASQCDTTFFNMNASSMVSKYRGDSEKIIKVLFDLARYHAPSTIFIDEIDSIMGQRGFISSSGQEHEGSRRMKAELLVHMDGISNISSSCEQNPIVFVVAASNLPWDLDIALLRRLEKKIYIPLPNLEARKAILKNYAERYKRFQSKEENYDLESLVGQIAESMSGFSCADIKNIWNEVAMIPLRRIFAKLEENDKIKRDYKADENIQRIFVNAMKLTNEDLKSLLLNTNATIVPKHILKRYETWQNEKSSLA